MNCESVRDHLDRYVTGGLPPLESNAVRAHLSGCEECRADEAAARFLAPRVAALPRSVPPERPLWAGIESRLKPRRSWSMPAWLPIAAAIALVAGAAWWNTREGPTDQSSTGLPAQLPAQVAAYQLAASDLEASLLEPSKLEPVMAGALRRDLATMNQAIRETSAALETDPGNEVLHQLHLSTLRRKLDLLRRAAANYTES
jgi:predicted anti-sigma-YlaC factor YlaD